MRNFETNHLPIAELSAESLNRAQLVAKFIDHDPFVFRYSAAKLLGASPSELRSGTLVLSSHAEKVRGWPGPIVV